MSKKIKKILALSLAAALAVGLGFACFSSVLKADEEAPEAPVVEQAADTVAEEPEVVAEVPAEPAVVTEEIVIERPAEEPAAIAEEETAPTEETAEEAAPTEGDAETAPTESETEDAPAEEPVEAAEETPTEEEKPQPDTSKMSLRVWDNRSSQMSLGQTVTLFSELQGFEGIDYSYRWQCNKGSGWQDVPGGNGATYSFEATVESLSWSWRLLIDY